ncbi:Bromodomain containing protein [Tritrichomonas foetus]|uniref:Bromodomain containing protein n=1 Tax=Tritrichomonas foetus TaxID=1144522 RepID=A0A1J4KQ54_9EUKA|nr:Bromodomain containing protein [Tritrichomonas foetus]|eukprot:OHT13242.1 Bromodomain containing protein [Tritrichomonas foetus]
MSKHFSVLNTYLAETDNYHNIDDFQYMVDQWKKTNRRRILPSRRNVHINLCPDQQQQPYFEQTEEIIEEEEEMSEEVPQIPPPMAETSQPSSQIPIDDSSFDFPRFAMINQRNFPLIQIRQPPIYNRVPSQQPIQRMHSQLQPGMQQQVQQPIHQPVHQPSMHPGIQSSLQPVMQSLQHHQLIQQGYMPSRTFSTSQLQYQAQASPSQQPIPDDSNQTLKYESFFINSRINQITQQQQRQEGDVRFLNYNQPNPNQLSQLGHLNRQTNMSMNSALYKNINLGMIKNPASAAAHVISAMTPSPSTSSLLTHAQLQSRQLQQQQSQNSQQRNNQPPQILKMYFNQYAEKALWSIIWEPDQCPNIPLVLDRSDRRIKFTDVNEQRNGEQRKIRKWDDMNFENTNYYSELFVSKDSRLDLNLRHSDPALNMSLIEPNITDFENFHHPKFNTEPFINHKLKVTYKMEYDFGENGEAAISPFLKDLQSLSGRRGGLIVVEHTMEALPFIMNVGMASRFITYWHKQTPHDYPKQNLENMHILEPDQTAPFIAQIPRNEPIPSINCLLYSVPVAEHPVNMTDFLLVKSIKKPIFYIRKFKAIYCAGFLEPRQVVMRPATKTAQDFHMDFIKAILINIFRGTEQYPGRRKITVSRIQQEYFPGVNDPKIRTVLRGFAKCRREQGSGFWEKKDVNLDQQFSMIEISPEMVCRYQSMLVGQWKLRKNGVNILTRSKRVYQQIQNLRGELTRKVAEKIEIELMKTPWARTDNFTKAFQGHAVQIEHADDGSQIMRSKSRRGKSENIDGKDPPPVSRRQLAGTDADLRSLTLRELREKLLALGVPPNVIDETSRWKQVDLLRQLANRQKQDGNTSELAQNYSRGPRNDYAASLDAYKKQYQATFENNLSFINTSNPVGSDEQFDDGNILDDISLQMMREDRNDDENEEGFEIIENEDEVRHVQSNTGDPPELVPYGICTCSTKIDWDKLGFSNTNMRTVAKLINVSWNRVDGLHVEVHWRRSPHQIEALKRNTADVYPDQGQKAPSSSEDLEEYILKIKHKTLLDKVRRTRAAVRKKGAKAPVQSYLTVHHQMQLVNDTGSNNLTFHLTPEIMQKIAEASERFKIFEQKVGRSHSKKKKSSSGVSGMSGGNVATGDGSDDDDDDEQEVTVIHRRIGRQNPVVIFNDLLKKLLAKLLQRPGDEFWVFKKPVLKKDVPDYHNFVSNPMCFEDIERKTNNLEYTTISKFYSDVKLIETNCKLYNTGRNDELVALSAKMMKDFQYELSLIREELDQREQEIDPVLRKNQE